MCIRHHYSQRLSPQDLLSCLFIITPISLFSLTLGNQLIPSPFEIFKADKLLFYSCFTWIHFLPSACVCVCLCACTYILKVSSTVLDIQCFIYTDYVNFIRACYIFWTHFFEGFFPSSPTLAIYEYLIFWTVCIQLNKNVIS